MAFGRASLHARADRTVVLVHGCIDVLARRATNDACRFIAARIRVSVL